jgi:hypothetical protein
MTSITLTGCGNNGDGNKGNNGNSGNGTNSGNVSPAPDSDPYAATRVSIVVSKNAMQAGETCQFKAVTLDKNGGSSIDGSPMVITWSSSDTAIATVDGNGLVTAVSAGNASITATSGLLSTNVTVAVTATQTPATTTTTTTTSSPIVATITVTQATTSMAIGSTSRLGVVAFDRDGNPVSVPFIWSSSDTAVATVDGNGLVTAVSAGNASIAATSGFVSGKISMTVPPAWQTNGEPILMQKDAAGNLFTTEKQSADGSIALVAYASNRTRAAAWTLVTPLAGGQAFCEGFGFTPDGRYAVALCTQSYSGEYAWYHQGKIWFVKVSLADGIVTQTHLLDNGVVTAVAIDADGMYAVYETVNQSAHWFVRSLDWDGVNWSYVPYDSSEQFSVLTTDTTGVYISGTITQEGGYNRVWATKYTKDISKRLWAEQYRPFGENTVDLTEGLAIAPADGMLYMSAMIGIGSSSVKSTYAILRIDPSTGKMKDQFPTTALMEKLLFSASGDLYGMKHFSGYNVPMRISPTTGTVLWSGTSAVNDVVILMDGMAATLQSKAIGLYDSLTGAIH